MKKILILILAISLALCMTACTDDKNDTPPLGQDNGDTFEPGDGARDGSDDSDIDNDIVVLSGKIAAVYDDSLLLASENKNMYRLYNVSVKDVVIYDESGIETSFNELKAGMLLDIEYSGTVLDCYPSIPSGISKITVTGTEYDLIGFYTKIIGDLYDTDPGLNSEIEMLAFDFTGLLNLTNIEKDALVYTLGNIYGIESFASNFDDLCDAGLIDRSALYFEKGLLITISSNEITNNKFEFNADKWRSGLGAYFFTECEAVYKDGEWSYVVGAHMIS